MLGIIPMCFFLDNKLRERTIFHSYYTISLSSCISVSLDCPRDLSNDIYQKLLIKTSSNCLTIKTGQKAGKREKMSI